MAIDEENGIVVVIVYGNANDLGLNLSWRNFMFLFVLFWIVNIWKKMHPFGFKPGSFNLRDTSGLKRQPLNQGIVLERI